MKLKIAVLPGDGIGPEVTNESIKVLNCLAKKFNHEVEMNHGLVGAIAIDHYNDPYPDETHKLCLESDAVLFGAIGDPKYDNDPKAKVRPEQGLLKLRKKLGLYANLRPTIVFDSLLGMSPIKEDRITGTDILFVRELTGGIYFVVSPNYTIQFELLMDDVQQFTISADTAQKEKFIITGSFDNDIFYS